MPITLLAIANFLHLLATVTWIGGMVVARLIIVPALAKFPDDARRDAMAAIGQRASSYTYGAIVVFFITGLTMLSQNPNFAGFLVLSNTWTIVILIKHVVIALLVISTAYVNETVNRKLRETRGTADYARWSERRKDMSDANFLLALIVLGLTAIATSIPPGG